MFFGTIHRNGSNWVLVKKTLSFRLIGKVGEEGAIVLKCHKLCAEKIGFSLENEFISDIS
jgi:hypothetical protein